MGLGLHGGGAGAARFFAKRGWRVTVTDLKSRRELAPSLKELRGFSSIRYVLGQHRKKDFLGTDLIIKGAGISWQHPLLALARKKNTPVESDVGIFFELCSAPVIGVTGSKGKSTVASLIASLLQKKYHHVFLAGNIRKSVFDILPYITKNSLVVLELSSWQLEDLARHKKSPHVAVITNILREHLNKYKNFSAYARAKSLIVRFQKKNDYFVIHKNDAFIYRIVKKAVSRVIFFKKPPFRIANSRLLGAHNEENAAAALAVAKLYRIPPSKQRAAIREFGGLEGRLEFIVKKQGVEYYNDTTATMPDATIVALRTLKLRTKGSIVLIAGGTDKKLDFRKLAKEIKKNVRVIVWLPGKATEKIKFEIRNSKFEKRIGQYNAKNMREAVTKASKVAVAGDIVLLSPGAASFGLFQNEFERGEEFVRFVQKIRTRE
ncbi:MAG: UDP-N-acetylmuramoyl-L-alanine--D-glutamate ligase [bacterium]|nr:UDP-N-acetylmuramoyl-L-alanine--D-glutamate ligase [bacterium]